MRLNQTTFIEPATEHDSQRETSRVKVMSYSGEAENVSRRVMEGAGQYVGGTVGPKAEVNSCTTSVCMALS